MCVCVCVCVYECVCVCFYEEHFPRILMMNILMGYVQLWMIDDRRWVIGSQAEQNCKYSK